MMRLVCYRRDTSFSKRSLREMICAATALVALAPHGSAMGTLPHPSCVNLVGNSSVSHTHTHTHTRARAHTHTWIWHMDQLRQTPESAYTGPLHAHAPVNSADNTCTHTPGSGTWTSLAKSQSVRTPAHTSTLTCFKNPADNAHTPPTHTHTHLQHTHTHTHAPESGMRSSSATALSADRTHTHTHTHTRT